jgi:hypothetical protein
VLDRHENGPSLDDYDYGHIRAALAEYDARVLADGKESEV